VLPQLLNIIQSSGDYTAQKLGNAIGAHHAADRRAIFIVSVF
jgi:hypothetical protein